MTAEGRFSQELIVISPYSRLTHHSSSSTLSSQGSSKWTQTHSTKISRNRKRKIKGKADHDDGDEQQLFPWETSNSPDSDQESSSCSSTTVPFFQSKKSSNSNSNNNRSKRKKTKEEAEEKWRASNEEKDSSDGEDSEQEISSCSSTTMPLLQPKKTSISINSISSISSTNSGVTKKRCPIGPAPKLVWVSTKKGVGLNIIHGLMYMFSSSFRDNSNVKIVCHCHKRHFSMAQFVQHGGGSPTHIANPLFNLIVRMGFS